MFRVLPFFSGLTMKNDAWQQSTRGIQQRLKLKNLKRMQLEKGVGEA